MAKPRNGLGRGLSAVFGETYSDQTIQPKAALVQQNNSQVNQANSQQNTTETNTILRNTTAPRILVETPPELRSQNRVQYDNTGKPVAQTVNEIKQTESLQDIVPQSKTESSQELTVQQNQAIEEVSPDVEEKTAEEISIDWIKPNPNQPRSTFNADEIEELASSIEKNGLLQPILVRPVGENRYEIIAGERRYRACKQAGLSVVPVRIKEADDDKSLELAIIENIQRSDLNPIEEAYGYRRLMEHQGLTQLEVAQLVSKGRSTIANSLRLLELPEDAQKLLYEGKITSGHARAILSIPTEEGKKKLTEKLMSGETVTVREAESIARLLSLNSEAKPKAEKPQSPKSYKKVVRELKSTLSTGVKIKTSQGRNRIEIDFQDEEDLQRIFALITDYKEKTDTEEQCVISKELVLG